MHVEHGKVSLVARDGRRISEDIVSRFDFPPLTGDFTVQTRMIGYRGKERCSVDALCTFLDEGSGPVSRVVLKLFPAADRDIELTANGKSTFDVRLIPNRRVKVHDLERTAREIATQLGIEIWPADSADISSKGYWYRPSPASKSRPGYAVCLADAPASSALTLTDKDRTFAFTIDQLDRDLLNAGRRFVADPVTDQVDHITSQSKVLRGSLAYVKERESGYVVRLDGDFAGTYVFRPILLNGRNRFLFYKTDTGNTLSRRSGR
jgi:hypothetical protein